jgi:hypothetical protein
MVIRLQSLSIEEQRNNMVELLLAIRSTRLNRSFRSKLLSVMKETLEQHVSLYRCFAVLCPLIASVRYW